MASKLFHSSVFVCASAAMLAVNGSAQASDRKEYCRDEREEVKTKEKVYQEKKSQSEKDSATKEEKMQENSRKALYKQSLSEWTYDCEAKARCDDDDDDDNGDDYCPPVVSPSS